MKILRESAITLLCATAPPFAQDLPTCAGIDEDAARLHCYDEVSGRAQRPPPPTPELRYRWQQRLMADAAREPFSLVGYRPSYALVTYLESFNHAPYQAVDPENRLSQKEIKFGVSFQSKLADNLLGKDGDLWMSYTRTSYWQLFNTDLSSPFRETDYVGLLMSNWL